MHAAEPALLEARLRATLLPFDLELAMLFGSMARGTAGPNSDIDLAVQAHGPLTAEQRMAMIDVLALEFGRPIDVIDLHTVGEPLLGRIVTEGCRIAGKATVQGTLLYKHLIEQADFVPLQQRILRGRQAAWLKQ